MLPICQLLLWVRREARIAYPVYLRVRLEEGGDLRGALGLPLHAHLHGFCGLELVERVLRGHDIPENILPEEDLVNVLLSLACNGAPYRDVVSAVEFGRRSYHDVRPT